MRSSCTVATLTAVSGLLLLPLLGGAAAAKRRPPLRPGGPTDSAPPRLTRPFAEHSPWNTPLGTGAQLEPASAACSQTFRDPTAASDVNAAQWSHPIYFARKTDPLVRVYLYGEAKVALHVPAAAQPALPRSEGSDGHLHIIDPTEQFVDELYHVRRRPNGHLVADAYSRNELHGTGVGKGGVRAYGGSAIAGLIRRGELRDGIPHVLALAVPRRAQRLGPVWPATAQDDAADKDYRGSIPMGQLVALPRDLDAAALHLGPEGRTLVRALQDYGAYDVDSASDFDLYAEPTVEPELGSARQDWAKLRPLLRCVTNNRPETPGGPGARVVAPAPAPSPR